MLLLISKYFLESLITSGSSSITVNFHFGYRFANSLIRSPPPRPKINASPFSPKVNSPITRPQILLNNVFDCGHLAISSLFLPPISRTRISSPLKLNARSSVMGNKNESIFTLSVYTLNMTERTHDLAALTCLTIAAVLMPLTPVTLGTLVTLVIFNQIGSAFPDLDQPTAEFYRELPAGSLIGKLISPLLGSHRMISHSLLGLAIISYGLWLILTYLTKFLVVDMGLVWWAFVLGYLSHLFMDTLTKEGVPWLFPFPIKFGFPPLKFMRITTGQFFEVFVLYPGLFVLNGYLVYANYSKFTEFVSTYIIK